MTTDMAPSTTDGRLLDITANAATIVYFGVIQHFSLWMERKHNDMQHFLIYFTITLPLVVSRIIPQKDDGIFS